MGRPFVSIAGKPVHVDEMLETKRLRSIIVIGNIPLAALSEGGSIF